MRNISNIVLIVIIYIQYSCTNIVGHNGILSVNRRVVKDGTNTTIVESDISYNTDSLLNNFKKLTDPDYNMVKNNCIKVRDQLFQEYLKATNDSVRSDVLSKGSVLIENILVDQIFPFWYGTPWDFNGHSNIPGKGEIACGYFVSTTLNHIGLNVDRYKLAQQSPKNEALTLSITGDVKYFLNISPSELRNYLIRNKEPEGLYFVGLDCHVGYLLFRKNKLFFIHSNNFGGDCVMIERADKSIGFQSSVYYITDITSNNELIKKWILGEKLNIKTQSNWAFTDEGPFRY
jgi:hypothetical protein